MHINFEVNHCCFAEFEGFESSQKCAGAGLFLKAGEDGIGGAAAVVQQHDFFLVYAALSHEVPGENVEDAVSVQFDPQEQGFSQPRSGNIVAFGVRDPEYDLRRRRRAVDDGRGQSGDFRGPLVGRLLVRAGSDGVRDDVVAVGDRLVAGLEVTVEFDGSVALLLDDGVVLNDDGVGENAVGLAFDAAALNQWTFFLFVQKCERSLTPTGSAGLASARVLEGEQFALKPLVRRQRDGHRFGAADQGY